MTIPLLICDWCRIRARDFLERLLFPLPYHPPSSLAASTIVTMSQPLLSQPLRPRRQLNPSEKVIRARKSAPQRAWPLTRFCYLISDAYTLVEEDLKESQQRRKSSAVKQTIKKLETTVGKGKCHASLMLFPLIHIRSRKHASRSQGRSYLASS